MTGVGDSRTAAGGAALEALHLRKDWLTPLQEHVQVVANPLAAASLGPWHKEGMFS